MVIKTLPLLRAMTATTIEGLEYLKTVPFSSGFWLIALCCCCILLKRFKRDKIWH